MLSKIIDQKEVKDKHLSDFVVPTIESLSSVLEKKKDEIKREKVIESNREDPVTASREEANQILLEAQKKYKQMEAEAGLLKIKQEKNLRKVLEEEYRKKEEEMAKELSQNFMSSLEELTDFKNKLQKESEAELMELIFSITKKVIGDEVKTTPDVVLKMLQNGFAKIKESKEYEIKINPADYEILLNEKTRVKEILNTSGTVKFVKDEGVERGGCKISTESGEISSEPSKQMEIIMKELTNGT